MELPILEDGNCEQLFKRAKDFYFEKDFIKALEVIEDLYLVQWNDRVSVNAVQGSIFKDLAEETENTGLKVTYLLGSVRCFSIASGLSALAANSFFSLAQQLESVVYYNKSLHKAKEALCNLTVSLQDQEFIKNEQKAIMSMIKNAESRIANKKIRLQRKMEKQGRVSLISLKD